MVSVLLVLLICAQCIQTGLLNIRYILAYYSEKQQIVKCKQANMALSK